MAPLSTRGEWSTFASAGTLSLLNYNFLFIIGNIYIATIEEIKAVIIKVENCPNEPGSYVF